MPGLGCGFVQNSFCRGVQGLQGARSKRMQHIAVHNGGMHQMRRILDRKGWLYSLPQSLLCRLKTLLICFFQDERP